MSQDETNRESQPVVEFHPIEDPDVRTKSMTVLELLALTGVLTILALILVPNFIRAPSQGTNFNCKSNLKNIGTALEMYSSEWEGEYPSSLSLLTPNYLKTIPECNLVGRVTYEMETGPKAATTRPDLRTTISYAAPARITPPSPFRPTTRNMTAFKV